MTKLFVSFLLASLLRAAPTQPAFGTLPLAFERNQGVAPREASFLAHGAGYSVLLSSSTVSVRSPQVGLFRMRFAGSNKRAPLKAFEPLPGKSNYILGRDPKKWRTGIATFASVRYCGLYPGVDLIFHASQGGELEYDFLIAPGRDPGAIRLVFSGARPLRIDAQGRLVLMGSRGEWFQQKPRILQGEAPVDGGYKLLAGGRVGFRVGRHDPRRPLVIDPVISYATYLGGANTFSSISSIAVDAQGNSYVTGSTYSATFPVTVGAYDTRLPAGCNGKPDPCLSDAFVAKLNPTGTALVYSTFLGGWQDDGGAGIAVDADGNAYVAGGTGSTDFPVTAGALQKTGNAFLAKLDPTGSKLLYSTYISGAQIPGVHPIAISSGGDLYVVGQTAGSGFPILNALQPKGGGGNNCPGLYSLVACSDAFVMHWRSSDMTLLYSTFLGGSSNDAANAVATDLAGNAYVTGTTYSADFPLANAIQATLGGGTCVTPEYVPQGVPCPDAFVTKISADGKSLVYSTLLGGQGNEAGSGVAVDAAGNAYVTGSTDSANFPTVNALESTLQSGNCQPTDGVYGYGFCADGFVAKINPQGAALVFSTYLGGNSGVAGAGPIGLDASGNAYVAAYPGLPLPSGLPVISGPLSPCAGGLAADGPFMVVEFRPDGSLAYSALFGAVVADFALDNSGNLYLAGPTYSGDFPVTPGAYQADLAGLEDGFVAKIDLKSSPAPGIVLAPPCIVNAASYTNLSAPGPLPASIQSSGVVAPGEIIAIFGSGLGPASAAGAVLDAQGRIATSLAGVTLTFDGISAPLLYVQAKQINAIVPFEISGKQHTVAQLKYNGTTSNAARLWVADASPGIFTMGGLGNQVAAFNQDGTLNSPTNPAEQGSIVSMWATGLGLLNQPYADGQIVTESGVTLLNPPPITVDGHFAEIKYLGQAPDLVAGAIQINLVVPTDLLSGPHPIFINGNNVDPYATLSIK